MADLRAIIEALGDRVSTPSPVVVLELLEENIRVMQEFADAHGKGLRPHVKTHKCVEIGKRQLEAGAIGLTAGNLSEAEIFATAGCTDIFLAYPLWAAGAKAERLRALAHLTRLSVGAESIDAIDRLADAMGEDAALLGVVIEVDCGARRSGVQPSQAGALAAHAASRGLDALGVFTYPGHGGHVGAREGAAADQAAALRAAVVSLQEHNVEPSVVSAGSTPTAELSLDPVITEIRPGEYVFNDHDNVRIRGCDPGSIALFVATTVVSDQGHPHVIVDAGTKALAREGNEQRGYGQVPDYQAFISSLNEYHGFVQLPEGGRRPAVGEQIVVIPHHVCPVVNSFEQLIVVNLSGGLLDHWNVDAQGQLN